MNSSENSKKVLIQLDAINFILRRILMKDLPSFIPGLVMDPSIRSRTHQNSFRKTLRSISLSSRKGSGVTNGILLFCVDQNISYRSTGRRSKLNHTNNQLSPAAYKKALELNEKDGYAVYVLRLLENLMIDTDQQLIRSIPEASTLELSCERFEPYIEIPKNDLGIRRQIIQEILNNKFGIKEKEYSPREGQEGPLERWTVPFDFSFMGRSQNIKAKLKVYEKGEFIRVELSLLGDYSFMRCNQIRDFIQGLESILQQSTLLLNEIFQEICDKKSPNTLKEEEVRSLKTLLNKRFSTPGMIPCKEMFIQQLLQYGALFVPTPTRNHQSYSHLLKSLFEDKVLECRKTSKLYKGGLRAAKRGRTYFLYPDWQDRLRKSVKKKNKNLSKKPQKKIKRMAVGNKPVKSPADNLSPLERYEIEHYISTMRVHRKCRLTTPPHRGTLTEYINDLIEALPGSKLPNLITIGSNNGLANRSGTLSLYKGSGEHLLEAAGFRAKCP